MVNRQFTRKRTIKTIIYEGGERSNKPLEINKIRI